MDVPDFLQSKEVSSSDLGQRYFGNRKKVWSFVGLVILLVGIPLTVWILQRTQIFAPKAVSGPIELVAGSDSCVVSADTNQVSCASFPIKLTSPLGPPASTQAVSCTSDSECGSGSRCWNYQNYPGTCKSNDVVCTQVTVTACENGTTNCVEFPTSCHVPLGWTISSQSPVPSSSFSSSPSASASASLSPSPSTSANVPAAPQNLSVLANACISGSPIITLSWSNVAGATGYNVYRKYAFQSGFSIISSGLTIPTFTDDVQSGIVADSAAIYRVAAVDSRGQSDYSEDLAVTSLAASACPNRPNPPVSLNVAGNRCGSDTNGKPVVSLNWPAVPGALGYNVYRKYAFQSEYNIVGSGLTTTSFSDTTATGIVPDGLALYRVASGDARGQSAYSMAVEVKTAQSCSFTTGKIKPLDLIPVYGVKNVSAQTLSLANGLVSYWKFDETSGDIAVDSNGISNGTSTNATIVDGKFNKARNSSADNSFIAAANNQAYNTDYFTVAGWIKPTTFGDNFESFFSRRNNTSNNGGMTLEYAGYQGLGQGQIQCQVSIQGASGSAAVVGVVTQTGAEDKLKPNEWNHIACSYNGLAIKVYINGVMVESANAVGKMNNAVDGDSSVSALNVVMGKNPYGTGGIKAVIDEVGLWNRALSDAEILALAGGELPQGSPMVSTSPSGGLPGTSFYKLAESEAGLANASPVPYSAHPTITNFTFSNNNPGVKQIWVEFIGADGSSRKEHISVELVEPDPKVSSLDCSMDISKQNLKLTLNGVSLGNSQGKLLVDGKDAEITSWGNTEVVANINPGGNLEGKLFKVKLTKSDNKELPEVSCMVDTTLISLGARLFCREAGKFDVNGVKITLVDENGNKVNEDVTIDANGIIKNLKTKLQVGKPYVISIKAPFSIRSNAEFIAASGTNVVTPQSGSVFILPVGDIAPVILPDGKINTLDRSEIVRQWSVLGTGSGKTGDFNRDTKVNSIDWACMRYDFNKEDQGIPDKASGNNGSPVPSASVTSSPTASISASSTPQASVSSPSPLPSPSAGQRAAFFLLNPIQGSSYPNGDEFIVDVNIWSQKEAANLFAAKISFDPTALEVVRIEKGTTLTSWAEEFFDNQAGKVSLVAGVTNPGLQTTEGNDVRMARIIFKGKKVGTTTVSMTNESEIFSNADNANILTTLFSTQIAITN